MLGRLEVLSSVHPHTRGEYIKQRLSIPLQRFTPTRVGNTPKVCA